MYEYEEKENAGVAVFETQTYWWRTPKTTHVGWILKTVNFWWTYSVVNYNFTPLCELDARPMNNKYDRYDTIDEAKDAFVIQYESLKKWRDSKPSLARKAT